MDHELLAAGSCEVYDTFITYKLSKNVADKVLSLLVLLLEILETKNGNADSQKSAFPLIFPEVHMHRVLQLHTFLQQQKCLFRPAGDEAAGVIYDAVAGEISVV